jgi:uncharacterized metal-binding protein YceD (DUF177 family)
VDHARRSPGDCREQPQVSKKPRPEFHCPIEVEHVPPGGCTEYLTADETELAALAVRLKLPRLLSLRSRLRVERLRAGGATVSGELTADVAQTCVVTLEEFRSTLTFPVARVFLPPKEIPDDDSEEADADPVIEGRIDLGELVTETLSLNLDPYPKTPGAQFEAPSAESKPSASAFAVLEQLKSAGG